eukprot:1798222-Pyramimonas_sp.AAC.1
MDQSDAGSAGIFSRGNNQTRHLLATDPTWVYSLQVQAKQNQAMSKLDKIRADQVCKPASRSTVNN